MMKAKAKDENDRLLDGTLPFDLEDDVEPMKADSGVRKASLRLVEEGADERELPPPSDVHAEAALLATLVWNGAYAPGSVTIAAVRDVLDRPEMFYSVAHRHIYEAIDALHKAGTPPDPVAVHSELARRRVEHVIGGIEYLEQLVASVQNTSDAKLRGYAQAIRDTWTRRNLLEAAAKMTAAARAGGVRACEIAENAQNLVNEVVKSAVTDATYVRVSACLTQVVRRLMKGEQLGIPTGFRDIDEATGGLFPKETTVIAARTSVGKSTLAAQLAMNLTTNPRQAVLYITLEMPAEVFTARLAASLAHVDFSKLRRGTVTTDEMSRILDASAVVGKGQVYFAACRIQTLQSIHAMAVKLATKLALEGVRLVAIVIDHIGLVKASVQATRGNRETQVAETSRGLGWLAEELNLSVIALAQLNREAENLKDDDAMPQISQIRESGSVEQDADNIWILHRKFDKRGMPVPHKPAFLSVAKARNDKRAFVKLGCEMEFVRFTNWDAA